MDSTWHRGHKESAYEGQIQQIHLLKLIWIIFKILDYHIMIMFTPSLVQDISYLNDALTVNTAG